MKSFSKIVGLSVLSFLYSCNQSSDHPSTSDALFTKLSSDNTRVNFVNTLEETVALNIFDYDYLYNGAGVACGDVNGDGLVDLYFVGNTTPNKLYLNEGDFRFRDITAIAGVAGKEKSWKTGVSMMDVNGDGKLDIYVCYSGVLKDDERANQLFINNGNNNQGEPAFTESAASYGIDAKGTYTTQANFFDYDLDGDLDLFMVNHGVDYNASFTRALLNRSVRHEQYGNRLYRHDGDKFVEVSDSAGIFGGWMNYGLSASVSDLNGDGYPDLYVANDFDERDFLYINNGNGTFRESLKESFNHISKYTMGSDAADINNDLWPDVVTMDMLPNSNHRKKLLKGPDDFDHYNFFDERGYHKQQMRNMLQVHRGLDEKGQPVFSEVGQLAGISSTDWSWASLFADFDNDGNKDLFITNGIGKDLFNLDFQKYDFQTLRQEAMKGRKDPASDEGRKITFSMVDKIPSTLVSNYIYRNRGGVQFEDKTTAWGLEEKLITTGGAYVDLDNDGDLDLVTNNTNSEAGIYRNNAREQNPKQHYVRVKLEGEYKNRFAIGSKVYVTTASNTQFIEAYTVRGFQSTVDNVIHFGTGSDSVVSSLKVLWPDGRSTEVKGIAADTTIVLKQSEAPSKSPVQAGSVAVRKGVLQDITKQAKVSFEHLENAYIDFKSERLVLGKLSTQGPKVATGDVNGDGNDDFFIGGASGQSGKLYLGKNGTFNEAPKQPWEQDKESEDVDAVFLDADGDQDLDLYVVSGGAEFKEGPSLNDRLYVNLGKGVFVKANGALPEKKESGGCVAAGDFDKDGDVDLFVGGWSKFNSYPNATPGRLLRNDSRGTAIQFTDVTDEVAPMLRESGLTTDATWVDVDNNGWQDLVIVGQWSPIRVYLNTDGKLSVNQHAGLEKSDGFWNCVSAGDFDGDGDLDLVAGNLGMNGELKAGADTPLQLYYDDFDKNGQVDPICTYYENGKVYPVPTRDDLISQIPSLKKKYVRYEPFSDATIDQILSPEQLKNAKRLDVFTLESKLLTNDGKGKFTLSPLPIEAQYAPIQSFISLDFTNDGFLDLLTAGNFYGYRVEYGPFDASVGSLLAGNGKAQYATSKSPLGVFIRGDVRDTKLLKAANGAIYIIISVNHGKPQFLRVNANTEGSTAIAKVKR